MSDFCCSRADVTLHPGGASSVLTPAERASVGSLLGKRWTLLARS